MALWLAAGAGWLATSGAQDPTTLLADQCAPLEIGCMDSPACVISTALIRTWCQWWGGGGRAPLHRI